MIVDFALTYLRNALARTTLPDSARSLALTVLNAPQTRQFIEFVLSLPGALDTIASYFAGGRGGGGSSTATTSDTLLWPDSCELRFDIRHDRHPDMRVVSSSSNEGWYAAPMDTAQFDDGVIVTLEPLWFKAGAGVTIAEAGDNAGPNAHLRWRQIVCCQNGDGPIMRDGGLGIPDDKQEPVDGAHARLARYNETRGQVCPVRIEGGSHRKLWIEMVTPAGIIASPVLRLAPVQSPSGKKSAVTL